MPEWFIIARREFLVRVRTVWFAVVTVLGPIGMVGLILVPAYLNARAADEKTEMRVVSRDPDTTVAAAIAADLNARPNWNVELATEDEDALMNELKRDEIVGFVIVNPGVLEGTNYIKYVGANATNFRLMSELGNAVEASIVKQRWRLAELDEGLYATVHKPVPFQPEHSTGTETGVSGTASFVLSYAVMFVLYMAILLYAVNVMRSVVEEKSSRVVEIIVSTVKPFPLMFGKVIGVASVGLLQLSIWIVMAALIFQYRGALLGWFGVSGAGGFTLPALGVADIAVVLGYFLLGYFFYASLYAAIGAMVNSEQEAQQVQTPLVILLVIPIACMQLVADDPRGGAAQVFTLIPFSSPILMPMRYLLGGATAGDVALSLGILGVALTGAVWVAARVYRVGILMYGKRPSLRELVRWIRT